MAIVKLTLTAEQYEELSKMAQEEHKSIQDYIRSRLFKMNTLFTPEEAIRRIRAGIQNGDYQMDTEFTLPDIYGDEWTIERGPAGVFGKKFYNYISENPEISPELEIRFINMGKSGRRAVYKIMKRSIPAYGD